MFGLATAPAHVEDRLNDAWLQFAEEEGSASADGGSQKASSSEILKANDKKLRKKKPLKIAMEAMIRGFSKYIEEEEEESSPDEDCHHNVAAWHNVPHP